MAKDRIGAIGEDDQRVDRTKKWAEYQQHLDRMDAMKKMDLGSLKQLLSEQKLKPGSKAYERLKAISDRLADVQEKDFQARQIKEEIDRVLKAGGGGLLDAFSMKNR